MAEEREYVYRDPVWVVSMLKGLIGLLLVEYTVAIALYGLEYKLLSDILAGAAPADAYATLQSNGQVIAILSMIMTITFIAVAIVYLFWVYRICANVRGLGAEGLRATPGFAVGMYFIPLYNLVAPFAVMNEICKASRNALNWKLERSSAIVPAWWAFQLISVLGNGLVQITTRHHTGEFGGMKTIALIGIQSFAVNMTYHILQYVLVNTISRLQAAQHQRNADHAETFA